MKFKKDDWIHIKANGRIGQIKGVSFNSFYQNNDYVVHWIDSRSEETFPVDTCDIFWDFYTESSSPAPEPINPYYSAPVGCNGNHQWIDIGFNFTKEVCKNCDTEKT